MTDRHFTYYKNNFLKWLLAITLFISLWTLPGYARKSTIHMVPKNQNELILSTTKTSKSGVSYRKVFRLICLKAIRANLYKNSFGTVIPIHNALAKNTFQHVSDKLCSFVPFYGFRQLKTIPQSSDEDFFMVFLRG